ncbi:MAG: hypothetical protein H0T62_01005 [Parachlamydiaceae bacterium]|nr:hypothetical protein [Parachlamydiaceae bacterium]
MIGSTLISGPNFFPGIADYLKSNHESVKGEPPSLWETIAEVRKTVDLFREEHLKPLKKSIDENLLKPIKNTIKPIQDVLTEYPALKVSIGFVVGCAYGLLTREPALIRGVYGAGCVVGAIAVRYVIDQIGVKLELKPSTISLMHAFGSALRSAVGLIAGVALDIFKSISGWTLIGPSIMFILSLVEVYDLRCEEEQAEAELAGVKLNS